MNIKIHRKKLQHFLLTYRKYLRPPLTFLKFSAQKDKNGESFFKIEISQQE